MGNWPSPIARGAIARKECSWAARRCQFEEEILRVHGSSEMLHVTDFGCGECITDFGTVMVPLAQSLSWGIEGNVGSLSAFLR